MLGHEIAAMRKRNGLSQRELARLLNIKQNTMSQYERGVRKIPFDTLVNISKILTHNMKSRKLKPFNY